MDLGEGGVQLPAEPWQPLCLRKKQTWSFANTNPLHPAVGNEAGPDRREPKWV